MRTLRKEIKPARPFTPVEAEVFVSLQRTADRLLQWVEETLKPADLSPTQYNVLRILRGAEPDGLACREIGARMITRDPDITRLLDRLEKRRLVRRARESRDRRVITTRITPRGLRLLQRLDEPVVAAHRAALGHVGNSKLHSLVRLLELARENPSGRKPTP